MARKEAIQGNSGHPSKLESFLYETAKNEFRNLMGVLNLPTLGVASTG
jgi:hypothetical protein